MAGPSKVTGRLLGYAPAGTLRSALSAPKGSQLLSASDASGLLAGLSSGATNAASSASAAASNAYGAAQGAASSAYGAAQGVINDPKAAATAAAVAAARQAGIAPAIVTDVSKGDYQGAAIAAGQQILKSVGVSGEAGRDLAQIVDVMKDEGKFYATATAIVAAAIPTIAAVLGTSAASVVSGALAAIGGAALAGSTVPIAGTVVAAIIATAVVLGPGLVKSWDDSVSIPKDPRVFYGTFEDVNMITRGLTQFAGIPGHASKEVQEERKAKIGDIVNSAAQSIVNGPAPWQSAFLETYFQLAKGACWASTPVDSFRRNTLPDEMVRILGLRFMRWFIQQPGWLQALASLPTRIPYFSPQQAFTVSEGGPALWPATNLQADLTRLLPAAILANILQANEVPFQGPDSLQLARYQSAASIVRSAANALGPAVVAELANNTDAAGVITGILPVIGTYPATDATGATVPTPIRVKYRPGSSYVTPGSDVAGWDATIYPVLYPNPTPATRASGGTPASLLKGFTMGSIAAPLPPSATLQGAASSTWVAPDHPMASPAPGIPLGFTYPPEALGGWSALIGQAPTVRPVMIPPGGTLFGIGIPIHAPVPPTVSLGAAQQTLTAAPTNAGAASLVAGTVASAQSGHPQGIANAQVFSLAHRLQTMAAFVSKYVDPKTGIAILSGTFLLPKQGA